ncbi:MAG TPA: tRNA lysidine(34) synthetase TilS [Chitinophagaceae bacterium]|nr:tRNA lysidine(34) synthetase TilS [Chitinophagaceae bacterium]
MQLLQKFIEFIKKENLLQPKDKLLLAVSGGVDSVVLCELCKQAGYDFIIAHCNFQLRGEESERDEQFVRELAKKYKTEIFVKKFDTEKYAEEKKIGIQQAARDLRYEWFISLINQSSSQPINYNLTAHHADDNIETLLMNFFKGTGIYGLRGILPKQGKIIRPLLFARKKEILEFAKNIDLGYVEDSSNASDKYTRNYFRNQLIPSIQKIFPQAEDNLLNSIERFKDIEILYKQSIEFHKKKLLEKKGEEIHIPVLKLLRSEPLSTIVYEIIKDFGFTSNQTEEVVKLLNSDSGKYILSTSHRILKNRNWLIISPIISVISENILIEEKHKAIKFTNGNLKIEKLSVDNYKLPINNAIACFDADEITFPMLLRKWKQGDYFYPLAMKKKKKLSRFFIDQKLSLVEKEKSWVLEMDKKIIWVVGKRIDDRFKIISKTKNILKISLS